MDYMDDERLMELEQRRAEQRNAARSADDLGLVGMALAPAAVAVGALCAVLTLIAVKCQEQMQARAEAKCLEDLILDATRRAQTKPGEIVPLRELLGVNEYGR